MNIVGKFEKVSLEEWQKETNIELYNEIKLPQRATKGSAGYDFYSPIDFTLNPQETIKVPTGVRVKIEDGWFLSIFPRSSLGFKYRLRLNNTVGIIDSDYYHALNEGHIFIKITNESTDKVVTIKKGEAFAQGIFIPFGIAEDDDVKTVRTGGMGSTNQKN